MYPQTQKKLCLALFRICCTARLFSDRILTVVHFSKRKSISKLGQISKSFFSEFYNWSSNLKKQRVQVCRSLWPGLWALLAERDLTRFLLMKLLVEAEWIVCEQYVNSVNNLSTKHWDSKQRVSFQEGEHQSTLCGTHEFQKKNSARKIIWGYSKRKNHLKQFFINSKFV